MAVTGDSNPGIFVVVGVGTRIYAVPLEHVVETMRPLPVERVAGAPSFVRGLSVIRGVPVPVVDLGSLLGVGPGNGGRLVTLRIGARRVAMAVDRVAGIRRLDPSLLEELPPLIRDSSTDLIEGLGALDAQLLMVLRASRLLPEEVRQIFETAQ